jgi:hypothetical protein
VCLATASGLKDIDKSTREWAEIPINRQPQEELLEAAKSAAQQTLARLSNVPSDAAT